MLQVASRRVAVLRNAFRASGSLIQRRSFAESSLSDEFEIVENMRTFPLFSQKVEYEGSRETKLKYFRGSEWMKTCDSLIFNPDAIVLAESIKGKMDSNNCFHVAEHLEEELVLPSSKGFDAVKANVDTFLSSQKNLYVQDGKLGTSPRSCVHVRSVTNDPTVALALKALTFPVTNVQSKEGNEYRNNLTIYVARGNSSLENCVNGHQVSTHTYSLVINGNCSIRQMIDEIADAANKLYHMNNRDLADLASGETSSKDTINTVVVPCSCLRAKNNVSTFLFSNCKDFNHISHEHLDEIHRHAFTTGSLYTLDHTVISNNLVNALFGGVQLSDRIGTLVPPTESVFVNDSVLTSTLNDKSCTLPSTLLFIQQATGMKEMSYNELRKLVKTWTNPEDMADYLLAWTKVCKAECYSISYTIMKDVIGEMEGLEYNRKEKSCVCKETRNLSDSFPRNTTMIVVSSTTCSRSNHRFQDALHSLLTACLDVAQSWMIETTSSDEMNCQRPSEARINTRSSSVSVRSVISGIELTPTE